MQSAGAFGHSESDNWSYTFNDNRNCYYYDFLGVEGEARAGVAFHTYSSPDFPPCDSTPCCDNGGTWANHCCEPQTWDGSEGRCCDPDDLEDFDCQDTVSERCSPHVAVTCEELEETLTEAVGSLATLAGCGDLEGFVDGLEGNVPVASPDLCPPGKSALPWVQVCGIRFGDPDGEPLVFEDPVLCDRPSPCAMFDEPDPCERPDPCEAPVLESKVECSVPGLCDGGDVDGIETCEPTVPNRSIPAAIVCGNVVLAGRGQDPAPSSSTTRRSAAPTTDRTPGGLKCCTPTQGHRAMRPRTLAVAGLAVAALSVVAFVVIDQPERRDERDTIIFEDPPIIISEDSPDPSPHAFAVSVPDEASGVRLQYFFGLSGPDRPGGQEESIDVFFALHVDGVEATNGENRAAMLFGQSSNDRFAFGWWIDADLGPGFHVVHLDIDTTDHMTEHWEWTVQPQRAELDYRVDSGWRGGPIPLIGLVAGFCAALAAWVWALKALLRVPE